MTLRDIIEQINLEGAVEVRDWITEGTDEYKTYRTDDIRYNALKGKFLDRTIQFMYPVDGIGLVIEVWDNE